MRAGYPLRFYASPMKLLLYLSICLVFVVGSYSLLGHHTSKWTGYDTFMSYLGIGFFGLGAVIFMLMALIYVVLRRPLLVIDAQGWRYSAPLLPMTLKASWSDIGDIAVHRRASARGSRMIYLVAHAKYPEQLPGARVRRMFGNVSPLVLTSALSVPLNFLVLRASPSRIDRLLSRIADACAPEIAAYDITLHRGIHTI